MSVGILIIILLLIAGGLVVALWYVLKGHGDPSHQKHVQKRSDMNDTAADAAEHIFNDEFREELRNRGRLHFEKIIGENAMFLQQDLRLTTSQLNDYMKQEIRIYRLL